MLKCKVVRPVAVMVTELRYFSRGSPQSVVLFPLLWVLAVNQLLRSMEEEGGCRVIAYADDLTVIVNGKFPQTLSDLMQSGLWRIVKSVIDVWASTHRKLSSFFSL